MSSLLFSLNSVVPIFLVILLGMFIKKIKLVNDEFVTMSTKVVFKIALPLMIFKNVSNTNFHKVFSPQMFKVAIFGVVGILIIFIASYLFSKSVIKQKVSRGAFVQGAFRSNYVIIGYPLILNMFGETGIAKAAVLTAFMLPLFNVLAVIILSITSDNEMANDKKKIILNIIKNPLIIAIFISLFFSYFQIKLPTFANRTIDYVAQLSMPLALLGIGSFFSFEKMKDCFSKALLASIIKIVINPLIFVSIAYFIGFRGDNLGVLFVLFGSPTAISSFIMAEAMDNDSDLAANIIIITTLGAIFTIFMGVYILKSIGAF